MSSKELRDPGPAETDAVQRLPDDQIAQIASLLKAGRPLPPHLFPHLFEAPDEYELTYSGKLRRADVLNDTMAAPLQILKRFGAEEEGRWHNRLIFGDNLQVMKTLLALKLAGQLTNADGTDGPKLVYLDPPFATGKAWETRSGRVAYEDRVQGAKFIEWLRRRLILVTELVADTGTIVIHLDHRYQHYIKVVMDELLPGNFRNEIVVPRGIKGVHEQFDRIDALAQGHYSLLLYSKRSSTKFRKLYEPGGKPAKWDTFWRGTNRPTMRYELFGVKPTNGQWRWKEATALKAIENYERYLAVAADVPIEEYAERVKAETGKLPRFLRKGPKGTAQWYQYSREQRLSSDVWRSVKVAGRKTKFPTEKHEDLLERLVGWLTDDGDLVLDPFLGSGTTVAVSERMTRRWVGIDSTKFAIYTSLGRLLRQRGQGDASDSGFTLDMAGLYDYRELRALAWEDYKDFVLRLFQCRPVEENLGGIQFHGYIGGDRVLVYRFDEHPDARIGVPFLEDLYRICGGSLGDRCFIIAPALSVDPYEDYLDVNGVTFFFLRIPYSVIAELHRRAFTELRQPASIQDANPATDSVGFDFIQPPRVETEVEQSEGLVRVRITAFESEAYSGTPTEEDIADLAMVMVDLDYTESIFDLDLLFFADDLSRSNWEFEIPAEQLGEQILIVYVDVHGNELREVRSRSDLIGTGLTTVA
jgi:site-specific DNA-methyltransferase (adenine-specific)/adenine-specific DNA-methyltransferase